MWWRTRSTTRSRTARGARSRSRNAPASSRPDGVVARKWPSAKVDGLPMSWSSAASRTTGRRGARRRPIGACGPTGPRPRPCSAARRAGPPAPRDRREQPRVARAAAARPTASAASSLSSSAAIRSPDRWATSSASRLDAGQRRRLDVEPERRRQPDGPDHPERVLLEPRCRGSPTARRTRAPAVGRPVVRVHEPGRAGRVRRAPQAIALQVKSRRARSASIVSPNSTRCGRRKSA